MVDYLSSIYENNSNVGLAFIYCNYRKHNEQNIVNLVGTLLQHLLRKKIANNGVIGYEVQNVYRQHLPRRTRPTLEELTALLFYELTTYQRTYIVIDALDECPEGDGTRKVFSSS